MMNELEMKYYLKDLEQRMKRWESNAASQATCGFCIWVRSLWQATRTWRAPSTAGPAITTSPSRNAK